ncbi:hypothetical protein CKO28_02795 [Rhodovibrio sodomensis]|uniref:Uncharacterized protein n=1 Tax=Rhodovibrio sodomensis TaxID=1088 RepID=A0ABS1D9F2_9PROT|nr:hypothetical protein [Rhodovibrio sodomensis]MBK1666970.1 hypothetical protein [Rhodovibrio sodomensis]
MPLYRIERRRPVTVFETHFVNADTPEQAQAYVDAGRARAPSEAQEVASPYAPSKCDGPADVEDLMGLGHIIHNARTGETQST